ncbi:MAG: sigma-70 family RNA polymerase sigma factor [Planctomycetes bacterium]|nr:sigma-70 family RNA polymerase sigma factor [Planctomycetota bacterium]
MTAYPSALAAPPDHSPRARLRDRGEQMLRTHGRSLESIPGFLHEVAVGDAALATALMDLFRCTGDRDVFDCLVQWVAPAMFARVRSRLRSLGAGHDPHEVLQDTFVNIYRYPDRFCASRPGAFAAWSSTIIDNAIRRQLRNLKRSADVALRPGEVLQEQADQAVREPSQEAQDHEEQEVTARAFATLLHGYLIAFATLSERERFVLEMVEVRRLRYCDIATLLAIRPEALKMVVFRARKRIFDRMETMLRGRCA